MAYHPSDVPSREGISRILILEYWLPLLVWLLVSYMFSTDAFSSSESSRIIVPILKFIFPTLSSGGIDFLHGVVRKAGHVTEYFILGVLAYRVFRQADLSTSGVHAITILFVLVAALSDEAHQLLTAARSGSMVDVGYDCAGAVLATRFLASWRGDL